MNVRYSRLLAGVFAVACSAGYAMLATACGAAAITDAMSTGADTDPLLRRCVVYQRSVRVR